MPNQSQIKITEMGAWDFNPDILSAGLKRQGDAVEDLARRLVSRNAVSKAGELPGKQSGKLQKTIKVKMFRNKMGVIITHRLKSDDDRYPFMLAYGTKKLAPREDHIATAMRARRSAIITMLKATTPKTISVKKVAL